MTAEYYRALYAQARDAFRACVEKLQLAPQPRNDARPLEEYPRFPPGTCDMASKLLAELYPELEMREGLLRCRWKGDRWWSSEPHAWNVTPSGVIVDSTWRPKAGIEYEYWDLWPS